MTTLLIVNPTAGSGRAGRVAGEAHEAARGAWGPVDRIDTMAPGDATGIAARAADHGAERILVLGGDGTLHEAVNGVLQLPAGRRPPIGIIPAGTGNDYAKMCGTVGHTPARAIARLRDATVRHFDVGEAWGEFFINSVGIGFDAEVAREVNRGKLGSGLPAYLRAVGKVLRRFEAMELEVEGDGQRFRDRLLLLEIGIGPCVGGGFRLTPGARPDDGVFDVCAIQHSSALGVFVKLPLAIMGQHVRLRRQVRSFQCTRLSVVSQNGPLHAQFDGEIREVSGRMELTSVPGALPVLVAS